MEISDADIREFQTAVKQHSVYDFSQYSFNSLKRRLIKIIEEYGNDLSTLTDSISKDGKLVEEIIKKITVGTTELFRDPQVWKKLMLHVLPRYRKHSNINIWHPGCSTGQEVYSMMILLDQLDMLDRSRIYASDINQDLLEKAKGGSYGLRFNQSYFDNFNKVFSVNTRDQVAFNSFDKYFQSDITSDRIIMNDYLTSKPVFQKIDLINEGNLFPLKFDLIICRNVIIYFNFELQNRILKLFHNNLRSNGFLVLGLHESIVGPATVLFNKFDDFYIKRNENDIYSS
ncbi:MAG: hypothetical protein K9J30_06470 [Bacteroidales bacterium]|nr:hypothetical protein [Bacteroidales bacterium]